MKFHHALTRFCSSHAKPSLQGECLSLQNVIRQKTKPVNEMLYEFQRKSYWFVACFKVIAWHKLSFILCIMHTWHTSYRNMRRTDTVFFSLWQLEILLFIRLLLWYVTNQPDYSYPLTKPVYYEMVRVWTNETILTSSFINCQQTFSIFTQTSSHVFHPRYLRLTGSSACVSSFW